MNTVTELLEYCNKRTQELSQDNAESFDIWYITKELTKLSEHLTNMKSEV
jgi:hypothetical protein